MEPETEIDPIRCETDEERRGREMFLAGHQVGIDLMVHRSERVDYSSWKGIGLVFLSLPFILSGISLVLNWFVHGTNALVPLWYSMPLVVIGFFLFNRASNIDQKRYHELKHQREVAADRILVTGWNEALNSTYRAESVDTETECS